MLEKIESGDLIIAPNNIKINILRQISEKKKILNIKIMTIEEFKNNYFEKTDEKGLYYLMKNYKLNYDVATEYIKNIHIKADIIKPYYEYLKKENLIISDNLFKKKINKIKIIGYNTFDKYILDELKKYNLTFINDSSNNYSPKVYEFKTMTEEIIFIITKIIDNLKNKNINDIYLVNINNDYKKELEKLCKMFKLPIALNSKINIYSTKIVQDFLKELKKTKNILSSLSILPQNDIYNKIIDILNKYAFIDEIDDTFIEIIKNELKNATIKAKKIENAVKIIDIDEMLEIDKNYYILGFNQGIVPKIYKEKIISDDIASKIGIFTSNEKTINNKNKIINNLKNFPNIIITYKLKDNYNIYYPSNLINELNLEIIKNEKIKLNYSHSYNNLLLSKLLDNYLNYNESSPVLPSLLNTYPDNKYLTYNNEYKQINPDKLIDYLKGKLSLSYTSMNNYYLCPFRFYIQNILKLDPYTETFITNIGTVFHNVLAHIYDDNFDIEKTYKESIKELTLTPKEKFFMDKLYDILKFDIQTILNEDKYSKFNKALTEKKITIDKSNKLKVTFIGIADKIKYFEENGKKLVAIIDYKTGFIKTNLDNINYGINLQLPVYAYLVKKGLDDKAIIAGFYLQKLLDNISIDSADFQAEREKNLQLNGYTNSNINILEKLDTTYENSKIIKSLKTTKTGFSAYSKMITDEEVEKMINIVDKKIDEAIYNIEKANFNINPIRIDGKLIGCEYCKFKDLCYRKEEDIKDVINKTFKEIVGA